jgi:hypothetical protein
MTDQEKQAADIAADKFNEAVWSSPDMSVALDEIGEVRSELETGKGWGMVALESAKEHLKHSLAAIDRLIALKESA